MLKLALILYPLQWFANGKFREGGRMTGILGLGGRDSQQLPSALGSLLAAVRATEPARQLDSIPFALCLGLGPAATEATDRSSSMDIGGPDPRKLRHGSLQYIDLHPEDDDIRYWVQSPLSVSVDQLDAIKCDDDCSVELDLTVMRKMYVDSGSPATAMMPHATAARIFAAIKGWVRRNRQDTGAGEPVDRLVTDAPLDP